MKPDKEVKALDNVVIAFKPKSKHSFHVRTKYRKTNMYERNLTLLDVELLVTDHGY